MGLQARVKLVLEQGVQGREVHPPRFEAHLALSGHGIANTNDSVELLDPDGDGADNLNEYFAGTDPTNTASVLKVVQVSPGAASNFVLDWASVAGKVYDIRWIADLMTPPWGTVASNIAATPPMNVYTVGVTGVGSGFYRVGVQQ